MFLIQAENQSNQEALGIIKSIFSEDTSLEINKLQDALSWLSGLDLEKIRLKHNE